MSRFKMFCGLIILAALTASHSASCMQIDGRLDEPGWQKARLISDFVITEPYSQSVPEEKTLVKIISDDEGLYIGFVNQQPVTHDQTYTSLKDQSIKGDYNEVIIDLDGDRLRGYGFKIGRTGGLQDSVWRDEQREDIDWDGDWQAAVSQDQGQWTAEIFIPWSVTTSKHSEESGKAINVYLSRWNDQQRQRFSFPAVDRNRQTFISGFHPLIVKKSAFTMSADFFPYFSSLQNLDHNETSYNTGLDLFWKLTESQQLNLTLNPDFGQVESNDLVVNFSAIETFFEEKRPFFRENHQLMDLQGPEDLILVHTPRIGAAVDDNNSDINTAVRYTGISNQLDYAVLLASEDDTSALKGRDFFAGRALYKHADWNAGLLFTSVDNSALSREARVAVIDMEYLALANTRLSGQLIRSAINSSEQPTSTDTGWWLQAEHQTTEAWSSELVLFDYGDQLQLNDFGYVKRVNRQQLEFESSYEWAELAGSRYLRDIELGFELEYRSNHQHQDLPSQVGVFIETTTLQTSQWNAQLEYQSSGVDDLLTRGKNPVNLPNAYTATLGYNSVTNRPFNYQLQLSRGRAGLAHGGFYEVEFSPSWQLGEFIHIESELAFNHDNSALIWLEDNNIGEFELDELSLEINVITRIKQKHEIRWKLAATSIKAAARNSYTALANGQLEALGQGDNFSETEFTTQLRYRYQLGRLSELFLVYARGGEQQADNERASYRDNLSRSIEQVSAESIFFKIKLHF
jgi:hypothetical protein